MVQKVRDRGASPWWGGREKIPVQMMGTDKKGNCVQDVHGGGGSI